MPDQLLKKLVTVELADEAASIIVIGDVGRILRENVSDDLVDWIVALFAEGRINLEKYISDFALTVIVELKSYCIAGLHNIPILSLNNNAFILIISYNKLCTFSRICAIL